MTNQNSGKFRILFAVTMLLFSLFPDISEAQGLRFKGLETAIDERTSFTVFDNRTPAFENEFDIRFRFQSYRDAERGIIFRLEDEKAGTDPAVILFYDGAKNDHRFYVNIENRLTAISLTVPRKEKGNASEWLDVDFRMFLEKDTMMLAIDRDTVYAAYGISKNGIHPELIFGRNKFLIDIPSFTIKDLVISDLTSSYRFRLNEESGQFARDDRRRIKGRVYNPVWVSENSRKWQMVFELRSNEFLCAGYDAISHEIRAFCRDSLTTYNLQTRRRRSMRFRNHCPVALTLGTNFMNPKTGDIYAYEVRYDKDWKGPVTMARLDTAHLVWYPVSEQNLDMQMHHHCEWLDTLNGEFYIFGGFGDRRYNGSFTRFNLERREWSACPEPAGDRIWPRYFSAMGYDPEENALYIYGGMGNESGEQIVGRQYFHDLHKVQLPDFTIEKKWSLDSPTEGNTVAARNMVLDGEEHFYVLCYPESETESELQLTRFAISDGSREELGNTIPIFSDKITTNANLFLDETLGKLIAIVEESRDDISSSVKCYSIDFPPKPPLKEKDAGKGLPLQWIILGLTVIAAGWGGSFLRMRFLRNGRVSLLASEKHGARIRPRKDGPDSLLLFGSLTLTSSSGEDITSLLTGRLKETLLLILFHTRSGGISSRRLSGLIWPDKEEEKSKNVRGVTLNNLRKILNRMEGVKLVFEEGKYVVRFSEPAYCDYVESLGILDDYIPGNDRLLSILARGKFLKDDGDLLFDKMKAEIDDKVASAVLAEAHWRFSNADWANTVLCADILLRIDPLSENAIKFAVKALSAMGQEDEARVRYNNFINQYKKDYDEEYASSFDDLLHH